MYNISEWIRQARYRAKKHQVINTLTISEVKAVISDHNGNCAYCVTNDATAMDHAIAIKDNGPNVQANVLPCCKQCKNTKRNHSITWMYQNSIITEEHYLSLIKQLLSRNGSDSLKSILRREFGVLEE